jgi:hypothetical protein
MTLRRPTFLSREEWKTVPWNGNFSNKDMLQHLLDILEIPAFLEQFDKENCVSSTESIISSDQTSSHRSLSA